MKDDGPAMEFRMPLGRRIGVGVLWLCLFAGALLLALHAGLLVRGIAWLGLGFMIWRLPVFLRVMRCAGPLVRIDDSGVFDARLRPEPIPWQAISSVHVMPRQSALHLVLWDKDYMKPRWLDFGHGAVSLMKLEDKGRVVAELLTVTISFRDLSPGIEDAWRFVKAHYRTRAVERAGSDPFAVPAGEPFSWPLRTFCKRHVWAHPDTRLMAIGSAVNLATGVVLGFIAPSHPGMLAQPADIAAFFLCPFLGLAFFLRSNDRYEPQRGALDVGFGFALQLAVALAPWWIALTR